MDSYIIPIHGIIGEKPEYDTSNDLYFSFTDFLIHLNKAKPYPIIKLDMSTPGGDTWTADNIYDALVSSGKDIIARNSGNIASAGITIMLAAKKENRFYDPSKGLFHPHFPWGGVEGEASEIDEYAKSLKKLENRYVLMYSEITGTDENIMRAIMAQDKDLTPEQVSELGFANIVKTPDFKAVAMFNNNKKTKMQHEEVVKKLNAIEAMMLKISTIFKPKSLLVQDVNGTELDFGAEITDASQIVVGVKATIAGAPATGEYTMADGSTLVFDETGTVTEIKTGGNDELEALKAENDALKLELENMKVQNLEVSNQLKTISDESQKQLSVLNEEFKNFKAQYSKGGDHKTNVPPAPPKGDEKVKFSFKRNK
jgi:ATP-dependent protease ClpP protease subunit